jgi:protein-disulfide isomerase
MKAYGTIVEIFGVLKLLEGRGEIMTKRTAARARPERSPLAVWAVLAGVLLGIMLITANAAGAARNKPFSASDTQVASLGEGNILGPPDAPVTVAIYSDFQCVFCGRMHADVETRIVEKYVRTGKVRLELRHYPVMGRESMPAAEAALAAADQGKYWEYRDILFRNFKGIDKGVFTAENLVRWAGELGLNQARFAKALEDGIHRSEVEKDLNQGRSLGLSSLPISFVNGRQVTGAQSFAVFEQIIEEELAK